MNRTDHGDCFPSCIAKLLGIDKKDVPHFCLLYSNDDWFPKFNEWLRENHEMYAINWESAEFNTLADCMEGDYLAGVYSTQADIHHQVIMNGREIVFDPAIIPDREYKFENITTLHPLITRVSEEFK